MYRNRCSFKPFTPAVALRHDDEPCVQNGLAVTPSVMLDMMNSGVAISAQNQRLQSTFDPNDRDFSVPDEFCRGANLPDLFQSGLSAKQKISDFVRGKRKQMQQHQSLEE